MMDMKKYRELIFALFIALLALAEKLLLRFFPDQLFPGYRLFSKKWISVLSSLFSFMKGSFWDIGALCLLLVFVFFLIRCIVHKKGFLKLFSHTMLVISLCVFSAMTGWLGNHYAPKLSQELHLTVEQYSLQQLTDACEYYYSKAAEYAPLIPRDENGLALPRNVYEDAKTAGSSYVSLAETYPVFAGSSKPVKIFSLIGEYELYNGITGMFMPLTGEASIPANVPVIPRGFVMCHEAAHRLGIASEQEANFCAFLACIHNNDPYFIYSGYYEAFVYCINSLYDADPELAKSLYHSHDEETGYLLVQRDRTDTRETYARYDSPLQDISDEINDTYLKSFSQESGIRSYGEVTDYLIAWFMNIKTEEL